MTPVVKWIKKSDEKSDVTIEEFLNFVGKGQKRREEALQALIEGRLFQDASVAFYIEALRT
ncbi:hypothetical protein POF51_26460 [Brevibacillus sp. AG]|uniref:hypothetical protein n=1 Tax=Brevibacillus sp. AG TaxID=3020891 RepID=UPI00232F0DC8|nr:hypothetical protein [Brevibacillus sp. AG]MDC0764267.1 hypothetical protein [Brevibacillus sp. AG]